MLTLNWVIENQPMARLYYHSLVVENYLLADEKGSYLYAYQPALATLSLTSLSHPYQQLIVCTIISTKKKTVTIYETVTLVDRAGMRDL